MRTGHLNSQAHFSRITASRRICLAHINYRNVLTSTKTPKAGGALRAGPFEAESARAFGVVIRHLRQERGIAQEKFALMAGVDRSYYSRLERGLGQPSLALVLKIAAALGVPPSEIVAKTSENIVDPAAGRADAEAAQ